MSIDGFVPGWIEDPVRVAEVMQARKERGDAITSTLFCASEDRQLEGSWSRAKSRGVKGIFLRDREVFLVGRYRRPYLQRAGTCVSRGMAKGCQTSLDVAIADNSELLKPVEVAFAPIYTLARHEVGKDRCGRGDGAILADAAQAVHDHGVATTALFVGMTEDQVEQLAVRFAAPGVGTPDNWIAACKSHVCVTFFPETLELIFDCLAAGYAVPYAMNYVTGMPTSGGISDLGSFGPHCRCFTGVYLDENGETQLISSESWGRFPAGQSQNADQTMPVQDIPCVTLRYAGGSKRLAPGDVGVKAKRFYDQIHSNGEAWAVGAPKYTASSIADLSNVQGGKA